MKYCSKCGNALNDDMAFCPKCGEACIEQPTSPADQKLRDLESIHIILPKEELSWEYIRTHKDIGAIFAKQEKLAQQAVEIGKECMTLASMDEYNKIQEGVYRFYLQNAYALIDLAACLYEDSTELDAMWNEFKSLVAKGQLDAQKFINDMSSTDANYEIYAGLQILLSSYFTEALDSSVVADNESYQQAVVDILKRYTEALSLYLYRLKSHSWAPQPSFHDSHRELFDKMLAKLPPNKASSIDQSVFSEIKQDAAKAVSANGSNNSKPAGKSGCYIATAVYGSYEAPEVLVLRRFRDEVLSQTLWGRAFIKAYYAISPPVAEWLKGADTINHLVKQALDKWVSRLNNQS